MTIEILSEKAKDIVEKIDVETYPEIHDYLTALLEDSTYEDTAYEVTTCSKDYLSDMIQIIFENDSERHEDIKGWLRSPFIN